MDFVTLDGHRDIGCPLITLDDFEFCTKNVIKHRWKDAGRIPGSIAPDYQFRFESIFNLLNRRFLSNETDTSWK